MELDEYDLDTPIRTYDEQATFTVDNLSKATWAMRKLRSVVAGLEANAEIAKAEKARIDAWLEEANKSLLNEREYWEGHLTTYLRKQRAEDDSVKTITTPYGKITSRATQPKWEVMEELTDWLLNHNDTLIRVKYEVDKTELKKKYEVAGNQVIDPTTGEVVPFIQIIPSDIAYKVEVEL